MNICSIKYFSHPRLIFSYTVQTSTDSWMYVCMCAWAYVCGGVHVHLHVYMYIVLYVYMYVWLSVRLSVCTNLCGEIFLLGQGLLCVLFHHRLRFLQRHLQVRCNRNNVYHNTQQYSCSNTGRCLKETEWDTWVTVRYLSNSEILG